MDSEETSDERMKGEYKGIELNLLQQQKTKHFVTNVFRIPAQFGKMGDQIVKIDDLDISKMTGNQFSYIRNQYL